MASYLRIAIFGSLILLALQLALMRLRVGSRVIGKPPIPTRLFFLAKLSMGLSFICVMLEAWLGSPRRSLVLIIVFLCLWVGGSLLVFVSIHKLGKSLRMGIPADQTVLITSGVYRLSRNPIYLGLFCLMAASLLYALSWLNIVAVFTAVVLHHRIVLAEEGHLAQRFPEYESYRASVRRYL